VATSDSFADAKSGEPRQDWKAGSERRERQQWVDDRRPRTSAVRCLNLGVSFPAVRSLTLLSLADPKLTAVPSPQNAPQRTSLIP